MIQELLEEGRENAIPGHRLADTLGISIRDVTAAIARERRAGAPICAAQGEPHGYYLASSSEELAAYCDSLKGRAIELFKTRQALVYVLRALADKGI